MSGRVYLVGAGPGDPGLITVRGLELLRVADVVLHDRLVAPELLREAKEGAEVVDVGKLPGRARDTQVRIHRLLVQHATEGRVVVRLKGGDPFVFGRGAEELLACRVAGVPCEVVPGVTSAIAVPAAAGIPVTRRGVARSFAVVTAAQADTGPGDESPAAAPVDALLGFDTIVVLMSRKGLAAMVSALVSAGLGSDTPVACIQNGTLPTQRVARGTLADIAERCDAAGLEAPLVTVIGRVAAP
ncbi:MAG: uroporphyrinogen-III C-methyltransferase [Gemmatimonadales bacterium]